MRRDFLCYFPDFRLISVGVIPRAFARAFDICAFDEENNTKHLILFIS